MKKNNLKRVLAIAGILLLLVIFCLPMITALSGTFELGTFMAALAAVIFVPIMIFVIMQTYRMLGKRNPQNTNARIENIIFDVGKVLLDFDWDAFMDRFGYTDEVKRRVTEAIFADHVWDERDRGLYDEETYVSQMVSHAPDLETEIREVMRRTPETLSGQDYAVTWVKYLKRQGYHLYILSNFSTYLLDAYRPKMDFLSYMDGIVFSCEVKELKPEDGIFQKLLTTYGLDPEKSVFIDDIRKNCEGAERNGIHAIQFESFVQAAKELEELYGVK